AEVAFRKRGPGASAWRSGGRLRELLLVGGHAGAAGNSTIRFGIALNGCPRRGNCAHPGGAARQAHCPVPRLVQGRSIMAAKQKTTPQRTPRRTAKAAPSAKTAAPRPTAASDPAQAAPPVAAGSPGKLSALDAAARVLGESRQAMSCPELIAAMAARGYWTSPAGRTPSATLHAA